MSYSKESIWYKRFINLFILFLIFSSFSSHLLGQYSSAWKVDMEPDYKISFHNFLEEDYNNFTLLVHNASNTILYQHQVNTETQGLYSVYFPQDFIALAVDSTTIHLPQDLLFTIKEKKDIFFQKKFIYEPSINALLQLRSFNAFHTLPDLWGKIIDGYQWLDRKGNNVVARSYIDHKYQSDTGVITKRYLYLYHFREDDNEKYQLLRKFTDSYEYCKDEVATKFYTSSIELTDVNRDTIGEISTFYKLSCSDNDSVPFTGKLLFTTDKMKFMLESFIDPCDLDLPTLFPSSGLELHPYFERFMRNKFLDNL